MKKAVTIAFILLLAMAGYAQDVAKKPKKEKPVKAAKPATAKPCTNLTVNLKAGTIKGLKATARMSTIKKKLPCFTGDTEEGSAMNCGGGVFYLNDDFYFYSGRNYIEIRSKFTGAVSPMVLGVTRTGVKDLLGMPDKQLMYGRIWLYKMPYGTLRLNFSIEEGCVEIGIHAASPAEVKLCE